MPGRSAMALPLRQLSRQCARPRPSPRCLHTRPQRPSTTPQSMRKPTLQLPHRRAGSFVANAKSLFRHNPVSVTFACIFILSGIASIGYANYMYKVYIIGAFHKYPEPVAKKLRKAVYFTITDLQPKEALKFYRQAIQVAAEEGMDPFCDEVMGIKIQVAGLMETVNQFPKAIEVLERVRIDNLEWLRLFGEDKRVRKQRTNILAKTVAITAKLGELYGSAAIWDRDTAEECLIWAVETTLKEKQRRQTLNVKDEDEGKWMNDSETGAALEALAHNYEEKNQHYLAAPLFLQALNLQPTKDCHTVVLMSNLASSLAQQSPRAAREVQAYSESMNISERSSGRMATRESLLENAQLWAQKALDVAGGVQPPERNEECDMGCVVAMHNLGEFAEMAKDAGAARKRYGEAMVLAKSIGFQEGVRNAQERLKSLGG